ncbi:hypothetical protein BC941DRAFT_412719 [Chlamydoabsidia padenii]|nr:hypothetical protein BC941DRAFT_412719 [Chlamydoabsidia padenii]
MSVTTLTIVGVPVSTFTRTIRMALEHLKVTYKMIQALPHSRELQPYTPFGKIPVLLVPGRSKPMIESLVIRTYIDATYSSDLTPNDLESQLDVNYWISVVGDHVFKNLIFGIVKPREYFEKKGLSEQAIQDKLKPAMTLALHTLTNLDKDATKGPFLCGDRLTWADLYLYPPMADLFSQPEADLFKKTAPRIWSWYQHVEQSDLARNTYNGTVAQERSLL